VSGIRVPKTIKMRSSFLKLQSIMSGILFWTHCRTVVPSFTSEVCRIVQSSWADGRLHIMSSLGWHLCLFCSLVDLVFVLFVLHVLCTDISDVLEVNF